MWSFYKALLKGFKTTGALAPSSKHLAKAMARALPPNFNGTIVELGPGTGAITRGLIDHGISQHNIIAIESSIEFFKHMRQEFPEVKTILGQAEHLSKILSPTQLPVAAIVSSLPLRILSLETQNNIMREIDKVLAPAGYYIQYTYSTKKNPFSESKAYQHIYSHLVWINLPPARVDVFKKKLPPN